MPHLDYWYAQCLDDSECYSAVAITKGGVEAQIKENSHYRYGPIEKRTLVYTSTFDLFVKVTGEGGGRGSGILRKTLP